MLSHVTVLKLWHKQEQGVNIAWKLFLDKIKRHCCQSDENPLGLWKIRCWVMWQGWNGSTKENSGSKLLCHGCWTEYDGVVVIATAFVTIAIHWDCVEYNAESYDSVETVTQNEIKGQNCLVMVLWRHSCKTTVCTPWQPTGFVENSMLIHVTLLKRWCNEE